MKKLTLSLFSITILFLATSYVWLDNDNLSKIILKAVVNYESLKQTTPETPEVMDTWLFDVGVRPKYAILKSVSSLAIVESLTGVKVFTKGPHNGEVNYNATTMGYYNPKFLKLAYTSIEELLNDPTARADAQVLYDKRFKNMLRAYYAAYQRTNSTRILNPQYSETIKKEYLEAMANSTKPKDYFADSYRLKDYDIYESHTAMRFWLRRNIDGTDGQFLSLLNLVFKRLDPTFLLQGPWSGGELGYYYARDGVTFSGLKTPAMNFVGGSHMDARGSGFSLKVYDDMTLEEVGFDGSTGSLVQFDNQTAIVFRDSKGQLTRWYKKMEPSADFYAYYYLNKTKYQLSGNYIREDNLAPIYFYPDRKEVKGLSESVYYSFADNYVLDLAYDMNEPEDLLIYFDNGLGFACKKTPTGLDLYMAREEDQMWFETDFLVTSLKKIETVDQEGSNALPGKYPFASTEILTKEIGLYFSKEELKIMRNEIFARHGYAFNSAAMKEYFGRKSWYVKSDEDVMKKLTPLEKLNIEIIQLLEKSE